MEMEEVIDSREVYEVDITGGEKGGGTESRTDKVECKMEEVKWR